VSGDDAPWLDPRIAAYAAHHTSAPDDLQQELIAETATLGSLASMQISPSQGALMGALATAMGARRAVEVGTFTGYSALCVARALPDDGRLLCCDVNDEWTSIARRYWQRAGVDHKIDLRLGPALETLRGLPPDDGFDLAFIDADKTGYGAYFDELMPRMRQGGLILVDNTIWSGRVIDDDADDDDTVAIRAFNDKVVADERVSTVMLPMADGLTIVLKR
jgi:caffeoyl-CoA O-methyltransferase